MSVLSDRLASALVALVPGRPEALDTLRELYAEDIEFRDPIQSVRGIEAFLAMNVRLLGRMKSLEWTIESALGDERQVALAWTMRGVTKLGPRVHVDGMTHVAARPTGHAEAGRIHMHRDYWDLGELMASSLPGGERILKTLLTPLA